MKLRDELLMIPDDEYRSIDAFSYSMLKTMDESGPMGILSTKIKNTPALEFGSLVDILITDPDSKDTKFHTKTVEKPTASTLILADALADDHYLLDKSKDEVQSDKYILNKISNLKLWSSMTNVDKIKEKYDNKLFRNYLKERLESKGKIVISQDTLDDANNAARILTTHQFTKDFFIERDNFEVIKQASIVYQMEGVKGKGRMDLINVDHNLKVIDLFDIKTGSELPSRFQNSFYHFKYYLQVVSYTAAMSSVLSHSKNFKDYSIRSFRFLYLSKKMPAVPTIHEVKESHIEKFFYGWIDKSGNKIKGFNDLVKEYAFYKNTGIYDVEECVFKNNGKFSLELL